MGPPRISSRCQLATSDGRQHQKLTPESFCNRISTWHPITLLSYVLQNQVIRCSPHFMERLMQWALDEGVATRSWGGGTGVILELPTSLLSGPQRFTSLSHEKYTQLLPRPPKSHSIFTSAQSPESQHLNQIWVWTRPQGVVQVQFLSICRSVKLKRHMSCPLCTAVGMGTGQPL